MTAVGFGRVPAERRHCAGDAATELCDKPGSLLLGLPWFAWLPDGLLLSRRASVCLLLRVVRTSSTVSHEIPPGLLDRKKEDDDYTIP